MCNESHEDAQTLPYMTIHLIFFSGFAGRAAAAAGPPPGTGSLLVRSNRTRLVNNRSTFWEVFADVSRKSHSKLCASLIPSSLETSRSYCLSHLLPTSMNIGFVLLTLIIACRKTSSRSKVARDAIEYTRIKPCPSLTHWSLKVAYSS